MAEDVLKRWKAALSHILCVCRDRCLGVASQRCITLDESWLEGTKQAQHVVDHQDLTVAGRRCTDTDCWDRHLLRDQPSKSFRYLFEHDSECASLGHRCCIT